VAKSPNMAFRARQPEPSHFTLTCPQQDCARFYAQILRGFRRSQPRRTLTPIAALFLCCINEGFGLCVDCHAKSLLVSQFCVAALPSPDPAIARTISTAATAPIIAIIPNNVSFMLLSPLRRFRRILGRDSDNPATSRSPNWSQSVPSLARTSCRIWDTRTDSSCATRLDVSTCCFGQHP